jgi:hypothetical protein
MNPFATQIIEYARELVQSMTQEEMETIIENNVDRGFTRGFITESQATDIISKFLNLAQAVQDYDQ